VCRQVRRTPRLPTSPRACPAGRRLFVNALCVDDIWTERERESAVRRATLSQSKTLSHTQHTWGRHVLKHTHTHSHTHTHTHTNIHTHTHAYMRRGHDAHGRTCDDRGTKDAPRNAISPAIPSTITRSPTDIGGPIDAPAIKKRIQCNFAGNSRVNWVWAATKKYFLKYFF
jgi:hypothetical protein